MADRPGGLDIGTKRRSGTCTRPQVAAGNAISHHRVTSHQFGGRPRHASAPRQSGLEQRLAKASDSGRMRIRGINIFNKPAAGGASSVFDRAEVRPAFKTERAQQPMGRVHPRPFGPRRPQPAPHRISGPAADTGTTTHSGQRPMQGPPRPLDPPRRMPARRPHLMPDWARPIRRLQRSRYGCRRRPRDERPARRSRCELVRQKAGAGAGRRSCYGAVAAGAADAAGNRGLRCSPPEICRHLRGDGSRGGPNGAAGSRIVGRTCLQAGM